MNSLCRFLVTQKLQNCVIRSNQISGILRCSTKATKTVPLSRNPKHKTSPMITLISEGNKIELTTLDQAKKIAERRDLKLVSIMDCDTKTQRAVYKLMTGAEFYEEEMKRREEKKEAKKEQHIKSEKLLTLTNKITEHDLNMKIAKCVKWIEKLHEVRVVISGDDTDKSEKIADTIDKGVAPVGGRILQRRNKDKNVRFSIMPTIKKEPKQLSESPSPPKSVEKPEKPSKKLLEPDESIQVQQFRSNHTMALQLPQLSHHQQLELLNFSVSRQCSKCSGNEQTKAKRIKISTVIGILLIVKYGLWSFIYRSMDR